MTNEPMTPRTEIPALAQAQAVMIALIEARGPQSFSALRQEVKQQVPGIDSWLGAGDVVTCCLLDNDGFVRDAYNATWDYDPELATEPEADEEE